MGEKQNNSKFHCETGVQVKNATFYSYIIYLDLDLGLQNLRASYLI